jgi:hypothetical protein
VARWTGFACSEAALRATAIDSTSSRRDRRQPVVGETGNENLDDEGAALAVFGDYCVATAITPPIPTLLYRLNHDRVETAWRSVRV